MIWSVSPLGICPEFGHLFIFLMGTLPGLSIQTQFRCHVFHSAIRRAICLALLMVLLSLSFVQLSVLLKALLSCGLIYECGHSYVILC